MVYLTGCTSVLAGCRVWYWQPQPASHENRVQDHALRHPSHDHKFPYSQFAANSHQMYLLFALSLSKSLLFLSWNAPQAVFTYWLTSNCFSLGQVALLRLPFVREKFRIPERIKHPASSLSQNDGFVQSMKKGEFLNAGQQYLVVHFVMLILLWRLEKCSAGPAARGKRTENQKPSGPGI